MKLNRKFTVATVTFGVLLFIAGWRALDLRRSRADLLAAADTRAGNLAHILAEYLSGAFAGGDAALRQLTVLGTRFGGVEAPTAEWLPILTQARAGLKGIGAISVIDALSTIRHSTLPRIVGDRRDVSMIQQAREATGDQLIVGPPVRAVVPPYSYVIPLGRRLLRDDGALDGMIVASFLPKSDIHAAYESAAIRMGEQFRSLLVDFDFVLIDCPPGLTLFSEAAIRAADGLVVPTLPNEISFAAVDHLRAEIKRARPDSSFDELLVGTVVSKVRPRNGGTTHKAHIESMERLLDRVAPQFQLLKPYLPYCRELEGATWRDNDESRMSFDNRYGQSSATIERLVHEFAGRCGALMARRHH